MIEELVVLVDDDGHAVGEALKREVHQERTPLHLAFSLYVADEQDRVLMTRRADGKRTFPGVLTNSVCGHPAPGEPIETAVRRRVHQELGVELATFALVLPLFRYRATQDSIEENEICPVFAGTLGAGQTLAPDPAEVGRCDWLAWADVVDLAAREDSELSPWARLQVPELAALGAPSQWIGVPMNRLPLAARQG